MLFYGYLYRTWWIVVVSVVLSFCCADFLRLIFFFLHLNFNVWLNDTGLHLHKLTGSRTSAVFTRTMLSCHTVLLTCIIAAAACNGNGYFWRQDTQALNQSGQAGKMSKGILLKSQLCFLTLICHIKIKPKRRVAHYSVSDNGRNFIINQASVFILKDMPQNLSDDGFLQIGRS